jgi:hypothetical protein
VFKVWNHLEPEYFSMELGPLNVLKGLINEVLASDPDRSYLRKEDRISQLTASNNVHKSAAIAAFRKLMKALFSQIFLV